MKNLKLILLGIISFFFCIKITYGEVYMISEMRSKPINYNIVKEVCEHTYSNKEIQELKKAADRGNSHAQLKLGILYDIKSIQRYQQVHDNQNIDDNNGSYENKRIVRILTKHKLSPCIYLSY